MLFSRPALPSESSNDPALRPTTATVRDTRVTDLRDTAYLHVRHLPLGLFPRLGVGFVQRWHRTFIVSPDAVALTAVVTDPHGRERVAGFLVGATDDRAFRHQLLTAYRGFLIRRGATALLVRPRVLVLFLRTRLRPYVRRVLQRACFPDERADPHRDREVIADLTAIVVAPALRGTGAGRALVEEFIGRCARAGAPRARLVTATEPGDAVVFYRRLGWTAQRTHLTRDGLRVQGFTRDTSLEPGAR